jgi:hypothetical protein
MVKLNLVEASALIQEGDMRSPVSHRTKRHGKIPKRLTKTVDATAEDCVMMNKHLEKELAGVTGHN